MARNVEKLERIYWDEKLYASYRKPLVEWMLDEGGYIEKELCRLKGESRSIPKKLREVIYNEKYVFHKIVREFIDPLDIEEWEQACSILEEAWLVYQDSLKLREF
ncbi:MAG: hypothetical protein DSM107014_12915 [Gomphosphaeria aponina SAG 52.96 = DSM 107014]|uniref:Uncharacterized protein n=1 Tax=Gomphosphaeria aponina SAG 52.96 = DSM 107014 TaxID=1521640 RepID=A0A941GT38_9CHRO|nr:hypothetical protein [Gomphosphaeria aponina SAG 52.96 = DSM 107014]